MSEQVESHSKEEPENLPSDAENLGVLEGAQDEADSAIKAPETVQPEKRGSWIGSVMKKMFNSKERAKKRENFRRFLELTDMRIEQVGQILKNPRFPIEKINEQFGKRYGLSVPEEE